MPEPISDQHSIRKLFGSITEKNFYERLGWPDAHVIRYVSNLLVDFVNIENVYKLKGSTGKHLREVAQMLLEGEKPPIAGAKEHQREVHQHIGDYILFMMGVFPEYLKCLKSSSLVVHPDVLVDYTKVGKRSYRIVSEFNYGGFREIAPLFRKLSEHFELCVMGLGYIRHDLDHLRHTNYLRVLKILLN